MKREDAKKIKSDFVNMSQTYNGYEITDMWNMMCDQLFDNLDSKNNGYVERLNSILDHIEDGKRNYACSEIIDTIIKIRED